jgi:hypothetical protein
MTARPNIVPSDTLLALAERIEASAGPDRELDAAICDWLRDNSGFVPNRADIAYPFYAFTESLDAAMSLYLQVPERVPSDPRKAAAEALRQRADAA